MDTAAAVSRDACDSKGRSEAEKVLTEEQPPRHVILGVDGYIKRTLFVERSARAALAQGGAAD